MGAQMFHTVQVAGMDQIDVIIGNKWGYGCKERISPVKAGQLVKIKGPVPGFPAIV